jgi:hypothetical protein
VSSVNEVLNHLKGRVDKSRGIEILMTEGLLGQPTRVLKVSEMVFSYHSMFRSYVPCYLQPREENVTDWISRNSPAKGLAPREHSRKAIAKH